MLKQQVIQWILTKERDYHAGLYLLKQISPDDPLIQRPESDHTRSELFSKLGKALKSGISDTYTTSFHGFSSNEENTGETLKAKSQKSPIKKAESKQPSSHGSTVTTELPGFSHTARLAIEIGDLKKQRAYHQRKLHECRSDKERKEHIFKADRITDDIAYKDKLIQQLEAGEITDPPEQKDDEKEDYFEVPEDLYELSTKLSRLRSMRSKAGAKVKQLAANGEQDSADYQQYANKFNQLDQAIRKLDEHKKQSLNK